MTISAEAQKTKIQLESEAYRFQQITQAEGDAKQVLNDSDSIVLLSKFFVLSIDLFLTAR